METTSSLSYFLLTTEITLFIYFTMKLLLPPLFLLSTKMPSKKIRRSKFRLRELTYKSCGRS